jgi:steroid 5-alpha reductase family enzyme
MHCAAPLLACWSVCARRYQNFLLLALAVPSWLAMRVSPVMSCADLLRSPFDLLAAAAFLLCWIVETVADQQQWDYQSAKYSLIRDGRADAQPQFKRGFITSGLWYGTRARACLWRGCECD